MIILTNLVILIPTKLYSYLDLLLFIIVFVFIIWSSVTKIDITVATRGQISTEIPNVNVQSNYDSL
ncbi:MAG: hypothetical protein CM15mP114_07360 [Alphaproteobacteria bacterium]|nr:MAG: hypothetical protein CM15mP114_07360 [Alphaproteobacteria bacterium]